MLRKKIALFEMVSNIASIIAGALFVLGAFMPWWGMVLKGISIGGTSVSEGEKSVLNLFQFEMDGHILLKIAGGLILIAGVVLLVLGLFSILEKKLINLAVIKIGASIAGIIGTLLALSSSALKKEYEAIEEVLKIAPDIAVKLTPWGKIFSIIALVIVIIADIFCVISLVKRQR